MRGNLLRDSDMVFFQNDNVTFHKGFSSLKTQVIFNQLMLPTHPALEPETIP